MNTHAVATALLLSSFCVTAAANTDNLWADPGFEAMGVAGNAHSGERAGVLSVDKKVHWQHAFHQRLAVTPFTTYEARAVAKADLAAGSGPAQALFSYSYNCYGWFGSGGIPVRSGDSWTPVSRQFIAISDSIYFAPLVFLDAGPGSAWIDDLSITAILGPEETIAALQAKADKNTTDRQILMRYHFSRNDEAAAKAAADFSDTRDACEYACLMAQRATTKEDRTRYLGDMIAKNCGQFPDAHKRIQELFANFTEEERFAICVSGLERYPGNSAKALMPFAFVFIKHPHDNMDAYREDLQRKDALNHQFIALKERFSKLDWRAAQSSWDEQYAGATAAIKAVLADIGSCEIILGGKAVAPASHAIVLPTEATPSELRAASELRRCLELSSGQALPVIGLGDLGGRFPLFIGRNAALPARGIVIDLPALGDDGTHIELTPNALALCGNKRGVLYAVYSFLEEQLGWRWFTDDCITHPLAGRFAPLPFQQRYIPPFDSRYTSYIQFSDPEICVPLKLNGFRVNADESWGGRINYKGFVHTFGSLVPQSKYAAEHPEYYSEINGKRVLERTQLCLTNPDVLRIATATVRSWLKDAAPDVSIVSVSQNDWHNYCRCPPCQALADREESQSGPLLHFVNAIARDIAADYPHISIDTLAYQYTRKAPKVVRPEKNVIVRLCSIECCFAHTLEDCERNRSFVTDIEAWAAISPRLDIWDYTINFAHSTMPFPNLRVLQPNLQFFRRNQVRGMLEQGNRFTKGGEFQDLRGYVIAKLLWNPDEDVARLVREFTDAYYGPAAEHIRAYIALLHDHFTQNPAAHVGIYAAPTAYLNQPKLLTALRDVLAQAQAAAAGDPLYAKRCAVACMPLWYTKLMLAQNRYVPQGTQLVNKDAAARQGTLANFVTTAKDVGLTKISESRKRPYAEWLQQMQLGPTQVDVVTLKNDHLAIQIIPARGGRIWRLRYRDRDLIALFGDDSTGYDIDSGGYEEYSTHEYQSPGWREPYAVLSASDSHVVLQADLSNGRRLTRRISLLTDRPAFEVQSTLLALLPCETLALRSHPAFHVTATGNCTLFRLDDQRQWQSQKLAPDKGENIWFKGPLVPNGQWALYDQASGLAISNRFPRQDVDFCYVNASPDEHRVNLEQWGKPRKAAAPGDSVSITNTYDVLSDKFPWNP